MRRRILVTFITSLLLMDRVFAASTKQGYDAGLSIAGVVLIIIGLGLFYTAWKRKKKEEAEEANATNQQTTQP